MDECPSVEKAAAIGFPIIVAVVSALFALSYFISALLGLPTRLELPVAVDLAGVALVLTGLAMMGWTFWNRSPANVIVSTYITLSKLFRRTPISDGSGRLEPLVISGPQRYTRNPLYLGIIVMVFGWAVVGGYVFVFVAALVLLAWFGLFLIPFEERELAVLFGEKWHTYALETPMLIPFTKRKKIS